MKMSIGLVFGENGKMGKTAIMPSWIIELRIPVMLSYFVFMFSIEIISWKQVISCVQSVHCVFEWFC